MTKSRKQGGGQDLRTPQEMDVQKALTVFWYKYYTQPLTTEQRIELADQFIADWLDSSKVKTDKPFIRHPATRLREYGRVHTVADVLADFIMRVDQVVERSEEYPVINQDASVNSAKERKEKERSIFYEYEEDNMEEGDVLPPYSVKVSSIVLDNSIEDELFAETAPSVKKFQAELRKVKHYKEFFATSFAEEYGYDRKDTLRKIKRLDLSRVRECKICGSAFYAHDFRRYVCDIQRGIKVHKFKGKPPVYEVTKESACELERDRIQAKERYKTRDLDEKNSTII
ncbi:hypothetical protein BAOM_4601 [Peribacillus asahii]|uniref:Uncharacterized protein n=1 Tax=Peribacillus asahii TaxID=228899 RepID=A0A3T0KXV5_9BACI|nr:hypothetical protein [Peribacillus asahii]AZV45180.1 hypothetical protein BAOM_4601 [Peribacillus asahii]